MLFLKKIKIMVMVFISTIFLQCSDNRSKTENKPELKNEISLNVPEIRGREIAGESINIDGDNKNDGLDLDGDQTTSELNLIDSFANDVFSFDADNNRIADVYIKIPQETRSLSALSSKNSFLAPMNAKADFTGSNVKIVLDEDGKPLGLDINEDGFFDICIIPTGLNGDIFPPFILKSVPEKKSSNSPLNSRICAVFSECIEESTINNQSFFVYTNNSKINGKLNYNVNSNTVIFEPDNNFSPNTTYFVEIADTVSDHSGNNMSGNYSWSFSTGSQEDITPPVPGNSGIINIHTVSDSELKLGCC